MVQEFPGNNHKIELIPLAKRTRKATDQSSNSQNTQSLRFNTSKTNGNNTNKNGEKEEEIKIPLIKIE